MLPLLFYRSLLSCLLLPLLVIDVHCCSCWRSFIVYVYCCSCWSLLTFALVGYVLLLSIVRDCLLFVIVVCDCCLLFVIVVYDCCLLLSYVLLLFIVCDCCFSLVSIVLVGCLMFVAGCCLLLVMGS